MNRGALLASLIVVIGPGGAGAQLIPIRTVPVATGDQFLVHPSDRLGMGGVSVALDDVLLDPFVNPAKGGRTRGGRILASPTVYGFRSGMEGGGRTLPITGLFASDRWFGGGSLAFQEVEAARLSPWGGFVPMPRPGVTTVQAPRPLSERSASNTYIAAVLGRRLGGEEDGLALGAGVGWASLGGVQGVEHLYAGAAGVQQRGDALDARVGLLWEPGDGRVGEAVLVHHRFDVRHDVETLEWVWPEPDPGILPPEPPRPELRTRRELDRTNTWGLHLGYRRPLPESDWRVGGALTANRKSHPKIPNYEIMNIPRDPGTTWAWSLAGGLAREEGFLTAGIDLAFEPVWSETWVEAEEAVPTRSGGTVAVGERTIENDFFFRNSLVRAGLGVEGDWRGIRGGAQGGVWARTIRYSLDQYDFVEERRRRQRESWTEWSPTWGAELAYRGVELRYRGRSLRGTGRPSVDWVPAVDAGVGRFEVVAASADFLPAPRGPLLLQETRLRTHQLSVAIPFP